MKRLRPAEETGRLFFLCAACVAARGLERADAGLERVIGAVTGKCDDCGVNDAELETWRPATKGKDR